MWSILFYISLKLYKGFTMYYDIITTLQVANIMENREIKDLKYYELLKLGHVLSPVKKEKYTDVEVEDMYVQFAWDSNQINKKIMEEADEAPKPSGKLLTQIILEILYQLKIIGVSPIGLNVLDAHRMITIHNRAIELQNMMNANRQ